MKRTNNAARRVRTPLRFQLEARECGAVALGIVLAYYGCHVPLAELRQQCHTSRDGVRVDAIVRAARSYGLTPHVYKRNTIRSLPRPFLMYWNFNHFLVVEGFRGDHVLVNDPAFGYRIIAADDFNRFYSGLVLTFEPNDTFHPQGQPYSALAMLVSLLRQRAALALLLIGSAQAVLNLLLLVGAGQIVAAVLNGNMLQPSLWLAVTGLVLSALVLSAAQQTIAVNYRLHARPDDPTFFARVLQLPAAFFTAHYADEIANRLRINADLSQNIAPLAVGTASLIQIVIYGAGLIVIDWPLALMIGGLAAIQSAVSWVEVLQARRLAQGAEIDHYRFTNVAFNGLSDLETMRVNHTEDLFLQTLMHRQAIYADKQARYNRQAGRVLNAVLPFVALICLTLAAMAQGFTPLSLATGMVTICFLMPAIRQATLLPDQLRMVRRSIEKIDDVLETSPEAPLPGEAADGIQVDAVTFGYGDTSVLRDIQITVEKGQAVAVVGRSGCGKSTLLQLIAGLYQPWRGAIHVNHDHVLLLDGDIRFFDGSLAENLGAPAIPLETIQQACREACIEAEIEVLPDGYNSRFLVGGMILDPRLPFSQGELQRLAIARALARAPSVLLLDEATSLIDPAVEKQILDNIRRRGCTCLIVSHRLSTIRGCQWVVVLDHGQMVTQGPLSTLDVEHFGQLADDDG